TVPRILHPAREKNKNHRNSNNPEQITVIAVRMFNVCLGRSGPSQVKARNAAAATRTRNGNAARRIFNERNSFASGRGFSLSPLAMKGTSLLHGPAKRKLLRRCDYEMDQRCTRRTK